LFLKSPTTTHASVSVHSCSLFKHSSRKRPWKLSTNPFCHGLPGSGLDGFTSLAGYRLTSLPPFMRGQPVPGNASHDFFSQPIPTNRPPAIGCAEWVQ
jgi:hypothetical protein